MYKRQLLNRYTLGLSLNNQLFFEVYYNAHKDKEEQLPLQDIISKILTFTAVNINRTRDFGFDIEAYFDIGDRWSLYAAHSLYKSTDKGVVGKESFNKGRWASYAILTSDWSFLKDNSLSVNLSMDYSSKNIQGFQEVGAFLASNLSIRKTLLKGRGVLSISANDLFNENDVLVVSSFGDQNSSQFFNLDTRYVRVGFRYKFGNTKLSTNEKSTNIDERDRLEKED